MSLPSAKRIDELERDNRELDREKRETKRELNNMKASMKDELDEKDQLMKQLRAVRCDSDRLQSAVLRQEDRCNELERQLKMAHGDVHTWRAKCEQTRLELDDEKDAEK